MARISCFCYFTAPFYLCPISYVRLLLIQTPTPSAAGAVVILHWAPTIFLGEFAPGHVLHSHLVCHPFRPPILALLVPIAFLFRHVGVGVFPSKILVMLARHVCVAIVIAIVSAVAALSIATAAVLVTTFSSVSTAAARPPPPVSWRWRARGQKRCG